MDFSKLNGLVAAVIQDAATREVLMVGFMNQAALDRTIDVVPLVHPAEWRVGGVLFIYSRE